MDEQVQKKGMSAGAVIGIVVIVALIFGGGAYAYMSSKAKKDKDTLNAQITELQSQIAAASATATTKATGSATTSATTADWKTYTSEKYNYSVKYPTSAKYTEISSTGTSGPDLGYIVDFEGVNGLTVRIEALKNTSGLKTLSEFVKSSNEALNVGDRNTYSEITVNGVPAYKYTNSNGDKKIGSTVLLLNGDYYYQIETGNQYSPEFTKDLENKFDQFVSTFQFTK